MRPNSRAAFSKNVLFASESSYDLTVFKLHCGKLTLKIYTKGERVLRIEAVVHNTRELKCGRALDKFPKWSAD